MENEFGRLLKSYRKRKGITLSDLAEYLGKKVSYISDLEHGRKKPPRLDIVEKIEDYLGVNNQKLSDVAHEIRSIIPVKLKLANQILLVEKELTKTQYDRIIEIIKE